MARASRKSRTAAEDVAELETLMQELEARLGRLGNIASKTGNGVTGAAADAVERAGDALATALSEVSERFRDGARAAGDEATKLGTDVVRKIGDEVEHRPLRTLAIAAGIGFLAGIAITRRN